MLDFIRGPVIYVVDGDTFDIRVVHVGTHNRFPYNHKERIRIADIDEPELHTPSGWRSGELLRRILSGREVECHIRTRDTYGRLVSEVRVLG